MIEKDETCEIQVQQTVFNWLEIEPGGTAWVQACASAAADWRMGLFYLFTPKSLKVSN